MKILKDKIFEAEEYLDQEFPKGKTKFRGQAMVLLALTKQEKDKEASEKVEELKTRVNDFYNTMGREGILGAIDEIFGLLNKGEKNDK